ncbi:MAG: sugar phosphate isomerase/epimerase [Planctomycetes bacterium]|nr:sugar phosphate isomerase/epimerase [Planctomycetota bacterium]
MSPHLAYVEHNLPAQTPAERFELARAHGLALEVAHRDDDRARRAHDAGLEIVTLQAYRLHEFHPIHPDKKQRGEAYEHLRRTIELAAKLGVPRVIAVAGYGREICAEPFEEARAFFRWLAPIARENKVRVLIEPMSPLRCAALTAPMVLVRLLEEIESPDVYGSAIDTGHVIDSGREVDEYLERWPRVVEELQLKDKGSAPPDGEVPLAKWLRKLKALPEVVCVEHKLPIEPDELGKLVEHLRSELRVFAQPR